MGESVGKINKLIALFVMLSCVVLINGGAKSVDMKHVSIDDNGKVTEVSFNGGTVTQLLKENNIKPTKNSIVYPAKNSIVQRGTTISIRSPKKVILIVDGVKSIDAVNGLTVKNAIHDFGIELSSTDYVSVELKKNLSAKKTNTIVVSSRKPVKVVYDGNIRTVNTNKPTVNGVLKASGISIIDDDVVNLPLDSYVKSNTVIKTTIVENMVQKTKTVYPIEKKTTTDDSMTYGTSKVLDKGEPKIVSTTFDVNLNNGKVSSMKKKSSVVLQKGKPKVTVKGTGVPHVSLNPTNTTVDSTPVKLYAQDQVKKHGWAAGEFMCLDNLWARESGWNYTAENASSGAYGIPQSLPGSKMSSAGSDWRTNPKTQIRWGLEYIESSYGSPCGAWAKSQSVGWY